MVEEYRLCINFPDAKQMLDFYCNLQEKVLRGHSVDAKDTLEIWDKRDDKGKMVNWYVLVKGESNRTTEELDFSTKKGTIDAAIHSIDELNR
tara:strand:+ start:72 stop:347 length:276 start_codon:yes stop_codon:yes gene_type:complete